MKRLLFFFMGVVAVLCASAQEHPKNIVGIHTGYDISWVTTCGVSASIKHGYMIGVTDQMLLCRKIPFYFETGLNFITKGYEIRGFDDSNTRFNYLQLPVVANYHMAVNKYATIEPAVGFYYAIGLTGKRKLDDGTFSNVFTDSSTSRHDFGFSCGLSTSIHKVHLGISYETSLVNIDKTDLVYGDDSHLIGYKQLKNNSIIIKAGVNF